MAKLLTVGLVAYGVDPSLVFVRMPDERGRWGLVHRCVAEVECPRCGSERGVPCRSRFRYHIAHHLSRYELAKERLGRDFARKVAPKPRLRAEDVDEAARILLERQDELRTGLDDGPDLPEAALYQNRANGGHARAAALPPERRTEIARDAARARWDRPQGQYVAPRPEGLNPCLVIAKHGRMSIRAVAIGTGLSVKDIREAYAYGEIEAHRDGDELTFEAAAVKAFWQKHYATEAADGR